MKKRIMRYRLSRVLGSACSGGVQLISDTLSPSRRTRTLSDTDLRSRRVRSQIFFVCFLTKRAVYTKVLARKQLQFLMYFCIYQIQILCKIVFNTNTNFKKYLKIKYKIQ